ncbi:MAG: WD40 repeat domain-containing protein [Treponema sp.]|nr:WD40 repeat domain-containing protein [Treponema sp.]
MVKEKRKYWLTAGILVFLAYVFAAARPIPEETILVSRWLSSLESSYPVALGGSPQDSSPPFPFSLGNRFGYMHDDGRFAINRIRKGYVSLSPELWVEYDALPRSLEIRDRQNQEVLSISNPGGYPLFLDNTIFIVGNEQNSLTALDSDGRELWTYDFPAPLTCIDAAAGFVLVGTLDGAVEFLDSRGGQVFPPFEPGGSRLAVILGCAISKDGSRLALVSGIDDQRFLVLEKSGDAYRVVYHEFLTDGFRRAVHVAFVDGGSRVAFEREDGIGIYDIASRTGVTLPLEGEMIAMDTSGDSSFLFLITSQGALRKRLVAIRYPGTVFMEAPFKSEHVFLSRRGSKLYAGGDLAIASFELGKK